MPWMLPTVMKNLFSRPATRRYPFLDMREPFPEARGRLLFDANKCDLCGDCTRVCPADAISVDTGGQELHYDPFKCIYCATCVQTCLQRAISMDNHYTPPRYQKAEETYKVPAAKAW
jgi:ech hydrogenase subunit F